MKNIYTLKKLLANNINSKDSKQLTLFLLFLFLSSSLFAQIPLPERLYYKFEGTSTIIPNHASSPPTGAATGTLVGALTQDSIGVCGPSTKSLVGKGIASAYVNTNWKTQLNGDWTISFWTKNIAPSSTLFYIFGDINLTSFRCFTNGVAGANNWILRGPMSDVLASGGAVMAPKVTTFVRDAVAGTIKAYVDGVLVNTVTTAISPLTASTADFRVGGGYSSNVGLPDGGLMDEFRFYTRALSAAEVATLSYGTTTTSTLTIVDTTTSYISPSGLYTYTTSGTYYDTIPNTTGCDSIITINLSFGTPIVNNSISTSQSIRTYQFK